MSYRRAARPFGVSDASAHKTRQESVLRQSTGGGASSLENQIRTDLAAGHH